MKEIKITILMGSKSDMSTMEAAKGILDDFKIGYEVKVLSAHRTPKETVEYAQELKKRGIQIAICGAGMSAALSGIVAAHTSIPVIGVPIESSSLNGMDALLSTVQMPPGVPVATVAIGKPGAKNAALLALRILSLSDARIEKKLEDFREKQRKQVLEQA